MSDDSLSQLLSVSEAIARIDSIPVVPRIEQRDLDAALGLILAQEVSADRDYPPFSRSLMDGYALREMDSGGRRVIGEIAAGVWPAITIGPGEAVAIMTGAPLPAGADAVVPVEDVSQLADGRIKIHKPISSGQFIVPRGADCSAGRVILEKGALLGPAQIAAAATVGAARVSVYAPPHVSILTTGDEIVPLDAAPAPGQIRNANGILLTSLVKKWGCELIETSAVRDDRDALGEAIAEGLAGDVLFITGGMSMGRHDHVPSLLREMGAAFHITKLKIKPGKPFVMATWRDQTTGRECQIIGLPGNPLSAFVCATRLAWRLLARMAGRRVLEQWITATLKLPLPPNGPREFYQPARLLREGDQLMIEPLDWKNSGDVFTMASADALLIRPESQPAVAAGSAVRAMMI